MHKKDGVKILLIKFQEKQTDLKYQFSARRAPPFSAAKKRRCSYRPSAAAWEYNPIVLRMAPLLAQTAGNTSPAKERRFARKTAKTAAVLAPLPGTFKDGLGGTVRSADLRAAREERTTVKNHARLGRRSARRR